MIEPARWRHVSVVMLLLACSVGVSACFHLRVVNDASDGEPLAHVSGDYRVRAGAPLNLYLRSVDGRALKFWHHAADIQAGSHVLLVDCQVPATDKLSRHELNVVLEPGTSYRLTAQASPREGCTQVLLQEEER